MTSTARKTGRVTLADTGEESMTAYRVRLIQRVPSGEGEAFLLTYGDGAFHHRHQREHRVPPEGRPSLHHFRRASRRPVWRAAD